jgi:hypothetical protein
MARRRAFSIIYDPAVRNHLATIETKYYPLIRDAIAQQLTFHPDTETRNRKPLARTVEFNEFEADWELRFGPDNRFRVFYAIDSDLREVQILAIGVKRGNRLFIAGEVI